VALFLSVMRLLGVRKSSVALGFGLLATSLGVLGAGSSGPVATRYELSAPLLVTGSLVFACFSDALMDPATCGGIEVRGVDVSQIPSAGGDRGGWPLSPAMRLVGTWDGHALTLTERPQLAAQAYGLPEPCRPESGSPPGLDSIPMQREVSEALRTRGVEVLMSTGCDSTTIGVVVPVADDATVSWLTSHYRAKIAGWLQPLPSGP
jgi:hypothetical protein